MDDIELLMLNDSMKYVSLLISCLEPLFISTNWFMDIGHLMWWLENRCSLHKCCFPFNPALTYRYNTNSIDTQFKKVTVVTSCIDTLIWVSILSNLYRYMYLCIDTHEGFSHTEATAKFCIDTPGVSIDTHQQVSIHTHLYRYIWGFHDISSYCQALYRYIHIVYRYFYIKINLKSFSMILTHVKLINEVKNTF